MIRGDSKLLSNLISRGSIDSITSEDLKYMLNMEVTTCQADLYLEVIRLISEGKSYDEIFEFIDSYNSYEYDRLLEDEKTYVKVKVKKDLKSRKNIEERGENNYE